MDGNQDGIAQVNYANGYLEMYKGYHKKAAEFHHKAYDIFIKEGQDVGPIQSNINLEIACSITMMT